MTHPREGFGIESYQKFYLYLGYGKMINSSSRVDKLIHVLGNKQGTHFNTKDLESMGYHFCDLLLDYCDPDRIKVSKVYLIMHQTPGYQIT